MYNQSTWSTKIPNALGECDGVGSPSECVCAVRSVWAMWEI